MRHLVTAPNLVKSPTPASHHRFHFLDALRGIAAIIVLLRHAPFAYAGSLVSTNSFLAVDFFFCLSGFVIAFSYEKRLSGSLDLRRFCVTRLIRLYPLALLGTLAGAVEALYYLHAARSSGALFAILSQLFHGVLILPSFSSVHPGTMLFPLDQVMWTLCVELLANLLYAVMVRLDLAKSWVLSLVALAMLASFAWESHVFQTLNLGYMTIGAQVGLLRVGFSFFTGVLIFRLRERWLSAQLYTKLSTRGSIVAGALLSITFVGVLCNPPQWSGRHAQLLFVSLLFPAIVYLGAMVALPARWNVICSFLGIISYPLYILHPPLLWVLGSKPSMRFAEPHPFAASLIMLGFLPVLVAISWLAATFYDSPIRQILLTRYQAALRPAPIPVA